MPLYDYKCTKCETVIEAMMSITDSAKPLICVCGGNAERHYTSMRLGDSIKLGITQPSSQYKEIMRGIAKNRPGSTINL